MKRKLLALLLNAFVLPGAGQLYLGSKIKGVVLIMAVNLLLLCALFFVLKVMSPVIAAQISGAPLTTSQILEGVQPYSFWAKLLLAGFFGVWGYGLVDLIASFREHAPE